MVTRKYTRPAVTKPQEFDYVPQPPKVQGAWLPKRRPCSIRTPDRAMAVDALVLLTSSVSPLVVVLREHIDDLCTVVVDKALNLGRSIASGTASSSHESKGRHQSPGHRLPGFLKPLGRS